jgi:diguanylate cyclase (GGDEF)-like protein
MLSADQIQVLISYIGVIVQLVGSVLLVVFFFLLRRNMSRKAYFGMWGWAWLFVTLAILMLVYRYRAMPNFDSGASGDSATGVRVLYMGYMFLKLLYLECLVAGTVMYATGLRARRYFTITIIAAIGYSIISVLVGQDLNAIVVWQSPVAVAAFTYCAYTLLRLSPSRRSLGSETTGTIFGLAGAVWALYAGAFGLNLVGSPEHNPLIEVVRHNSYVDILVQVLLGFGMVVMLLEDAKREVDDAHAELEVAHNHLRREALLDPLTEALNRRAFSEGVGLDTAKAAFGTVAMLDMDNLKVTNDSHGHAAGDALLRYVVRVLRTTVRPSDRVYRWGGDEFLVVLPGASLEDAEYRLGHAIATAMPLMLPGVTEPLPLLVSVGCAPYAGAEELIQAIDAADHAMYAQKARRKSRGLPAAQSVA